MRAVQYILKSVFCALDLLLQRAYFVFALSNIYVVKALPLFCQSQELIVFLLKTTLFVPTARPYTETIAFVFQVNLTGCGRC